MAEQDGVLSGRDGRLIVVPSCDESGLTVSYVARAFTQSKIPSKTLATAMETGEYVTRRLCPVIYQSAAATS